MLSPDEVRAELARILASEGFVNAERLSRFLQFIVERELAGEGERLKEYVIGIEVFDRGPDFDPRIDSIVRVEAGRVRAKLEAYYSGPGRDDSVMIKMEKGRYAPVLERRAVADVAVGAASAATSRLKSLPQGRRGLRTWGVVSLGALVVLAAVVIVPRFERRTEAGAPALTIAVLPFMARSADAATEDIATRLTEGVTAELVGAGDLGVIASTSARQFGADRGRLRDVATSLEADVLVEARVAADGDRVRVEALLIDGAREQKLWVESFAGNVSDIDELERNIATSVAAAVEHWRPVGAASAAPR
jgi:TolB-like protein